MTCGAISGFPETQSRERRVALPSEGWRRFRQAAHVRRLQRRAECVAWRSLELKKATKTLSISFHFFHFLSENRALSTGCTDCRSKKIKDALPASSGVGALASIERLRGREGDSREQGDTTSGWTHRGRIARFR